MVFFVCGGCGESLKKNQVERHTFKCRTCQYLSCIDCSKEFRGNDYKTHTSCITENEKYGGANYVPKEMTGQNKQQKYVSLVREHISNVHNMSAELKNLFDTLLALENLPSKKVKFMNVVRSIKRIREPLAIEAWSYIETVLEKIKSEQASKNQPKTEDTAGPSKIESQTENKEDTVEKVPFKSKRERKEERQKNQTVLSKKEKRKRAREEENEAETTAEPGKSKKKKRKSQEEEMDQENEDPDNSPEEDSQESESAVKRSPFKWKKALTTILQDAPEEGMKLKKVKRKVFALYMESKIGSAYTKSEHEIEAIINKKLTMRNDKYVMVKDRVKLKNNS